MEMPERRSMKLDARTLWCGRHAEVLRTAGIQGIAGATWELVTFAFLEILESEGNPEVLIPEFSPLCCWAPTDVMEAIYTSHALLN